MPLRKTVARTLVALVALAAPLRAQTSPPSDSALAAKVDVIANQVLQSTGVPSATIAVVTHGRLAYAQAYGTARLEPRVRNDERLEIDAFRNSTDDDIAGGLHEDNFEQEQTVT